MRSRYTAYCIEQADYLLSTWGAATRPDCIDFKADDRVWSGLKIVRTDRGGRDDSSGTVEFMARYELGDDTWLHHEISQFLKREGCWFFERYTCPFHGRIAHEGKPLRHVPCPCGSGKRYKTCCGRPA